MSDINRITIVLNKLATKILDERKSSKSRSARICQIIARYDLILANHNAGNVSYFVNNRIVRTAIIEWGQTYPLGLMPLAEVLNKIIPYLKENDEYMPPQVEIDELLQKAQDLDLSSEVAILERVESSVSLNTSI